MRGGSVKKFISLLCILPAILIMCGQLLYIKVEARPGHKTTLIIGDSIPYGMALGKNLVPVWIKQIKYIGLLKAG